MLTDDGRRQLIAKGHQSDPGDLKICMDKLNAWTCGFF